LRRNEGIRNIRAIHELAQRCAEDEDLVPQLVVLLSEIKEVWTAFTTESSTVIDCLVDLGRDSEYPVDQVAELRDLISFSRVTADCYVKKQHNIERSLRKGSITSQVDYGSANESIPEGDNIEINLPCSNADMVINNSRGAQSAGVSVVNENVCVRSMSNLKPARLPEIPLPKFYGDIFKWLTFRDRFTSMIDQRPDTSEIDKFYYLAGCLRDSALETIAGIPISGGNYQLA